MIFTQKLLENVLETVSKFATVEIKFDAIVYNVNLGIIKAIKPSISIGAKK